MKKTSLLFIFVFALLASKAQDKMYKNVQKYFITASYEEARQEIDKLIANNPKALDKAETWLWCTRVYSELYFSEKVRGRYPGCGNIAFEAFKKYEALEPDYKMLANATVAAWNWRPLDILYVTNFNIGRKFFEEKQWDSSYHSFLTAVYMGDVVIKNDLRGNGAKIDTLSVLYAAYAAQNGKMESEASALYEKFADLKIGGKEIKDAYLYILLHASNTKDKEKFYKYIAIAKEVYPDDQDWDDYEMDFITKTTTVEERITQYENEDKAGTISARKYMLYGQSFIEVTKGDAADNLDSLTIKKYEGISIDAFKKAYNKDNTLGLAAYNAGLLYYNQFSELDDAISSNRRALQRLNTSKTDTKDPKKKAAAEAEFKKQAEPIKQVMADLEKPTMEAINNSIEWLEKSYNTMKDGDLNDRTTKNCLKNSVKWLANCFIYKREKVKGKDTKAYDEYDAKFNLYDKLFEKYE
ncbi:MAG: hypothetical protein KF781_00435 [Chitinophagaceae bacterium]|nr:hypothetical protein [Chitinophagaceae bacterium]MCW5905201.1 hypothetical protein [Chitinophagaceae bacterium]